MAPLFMVNELVLLPVDKTLRNLITSLYKMYSRSNLVCAIAHRVSVFYWDWISWVFSRRAVSLIRGEISRRGVRSILKRIQGRMLRAGFRW